MRRLLAHWEAPADAGDPLGCLTTTFTYQADFFQKQCLGRFLGMDNQLDEGDNELAFVIEQEERLARVPVTVVVDRSYAAEPRNLRWDVLSIGVTGGVQHAKVTVLIWERCVRFIVASANLVENSYRSNLETASVLNARPSGSLPEPLFHDLFKEVSRIVHRAPQPATAEGPKKRALETLSRGRDLVESFDLPPAFRRGQGSIHVVGVSSGRSALKKARELLGGTAKSAKVLSPFFDVGHREHSAGAELAKTMSRSSRPRVTFILPMNPHADRMLALAPRELREAFPTRVRTEFRPVEPGDENRGRRLHAKALLLERDELSVALVGSSNFTAAGLGVARTANLEVNLAFRCPAADRRAGRTVRRLFPAGALIPEEEIDWDPAEDDEEGRTELPAGFVDFLLDAHQRTIGITLASRHLPRDWSVYAQGICILDRAKWLRAERPELMTVPLGDSPGLPFFVEVTWDGEGPLAWPLNVKDPSALPPPDELRNLPLDLLIEALSSTRPIHAALADAWKRRRRLVAAGKTKNDLDPLRRYAGTGRLLQRTRRLSQAFEGLAARLEQPAASPEALEWRLCGPVGPLALAKALVQELGEGESMPGEAEFMLAELALSVGRVDWARTGAQIGKGRARAQGQALVSQLERMMKEVRSRASSTRPTADARTLRRYVNRAFVEARA